MSSKMKILARATKETSDSSQPTETSSQGGSSQSQSQSQPKLAILKRTEAPTSGVGNLVSTPAQALGSTREVRPSAEKSSDSDKITTPQLLQRTVTPSDIDGNRGQGTTVSGTTGLSLYDLLKGYEFPYAEAVPLIHNDLSFKKNIKFLKTLKTSTDFLVVTAIGPPGAGKSTILSYLAGKSKDEEFNNNESKVFPKRKEQDDEKTCNFYITSENIIFIEMASIFNGSAAIDLIPLVEKFSTLETTITSWNLRLMRWALSVSHMVLIVSPTIIDPQICQLINSASTLHPMESVLGENCHPELVFVGSKCPSNDSALEQLRVISNSVEILGFGRRARMKPNAFILPHVKFHRSNEAAGGKQRYEEFRQKVYEYNYWTRSLFSDEEIDGEAKITQTISVQDWFNGAFNLWDEMGQSSYYYDYVKLLQ